MAAPPSAPRPLREPELILDAAFLKSESVAERKRAVRKSLGMQVGPSNAPSLRTYDDLNLRITKAGLSLDPDRLVRIILHITLALLFIGTLLLGVGFLLQGYSYLIVAIVLAVWWIVGFIALYALVMVCCRVYLSSLTFRRRQQVEASLPEFLRLVATNYRSGLPLDKALLKSSRTRFGVLSKEVELVVKNAQASGDLASALEAFGRKFDSRMLERAMSNIAMSVRSGSNISDLLDEIASNITKMRTMRASMAANVKNYVIFIIVAGVIIAPLMFSMSAVMTSAIGDIKGTLSSQSAAGNAGMPITLTVEGGMSQEDFDIFAFLMLLTNSVVSALVISMIRNGNFQQGIKSIPFYLAISLGLYFIGKSALSFIAIAA